MRFFDPDVHDVKAAGVVICTFDECLGQELWERMDEGIQLNYPTLHLRQAECAIGYTLGPGAVQQVTPVRFDIFMQVIDPSCICYMRFMCSHGTVSLICILRCICLQSATADMSSRTKSVW